MYFNVPICHNFWQNRIDVAETATSAVPNKDVGLPTQIETVASASRRSLGEHARGSPGNSAMVLSYSRLIERRDVMGTERIRL